MKTCRTCERPLDDPKDPTTNDCGSDCLRCAALLGDREAREALAKIVEEWPEAPTWVGYPK